MRNEIVDVSVIEENDMLRARLSAIALAAQWECPECGHVMTEAESKGYKGCPSGVHFVQHRKVMKNPIS